MLVFCTVKKQKSPTLLLMAYPPSSTHQKWAKRGWWSRTNHEAFLRSGYLGVPRRSPASRELPARRPLVHLVSRRNRRSRRMDGIFFMGIPVFVNLIHWNYPSKILRLESWNHWIERIFPQNLAVESSWQKIRTPSTWISDRSSWDPMLSIFSWLKSASWFVKNMKIHICWWLKHVKTC